MSTKGLTRRITRKQALSYERTSPNGIGVTSIAAVNGRRKGPPAKVRRAMKACGKQLKAAWKEVKKGKTKMAGKPKARARRNVSHAPSYVRRYSATKSVLRNGGVARRNAVDFGGFESFGGLPAEAARRDKAEAKEAKAFEAKLRKQLKADKAKAKKAKETKMAKGKGGKKKAAKKGVKRGAKRGAARARTYAGMKPLRVSVGGKSRRTFLHKTKGGSVRHIPYYALLGFKSEKALIAAAQKDPKVRARLDKRQASMARARERAAERVLKDGDIFTPNTTVIPYSEWSRNMTPNKKSPKKKAAKKGARKAKRTPKQIAAAKRNIKKAQKASAAKRRGKGKKKAAKKTTRRRAAAKKKTTRRTTRKAAARKPRKAAKRGGRKAASKRRGGKRTKAERRASALKGIRRKKARGGKKAPKGKRMHRNAAAATPNRRRHGRRHYEENRRRHGRRHYAENRRHFRRNGYMEQLKQGLKVGAVIVGGFLAHKVLTNLLVQQGFSRIAFFQGAGIAPYQNLIAGVLVAAAGIPLAAKLVKDSATFNELAGGMAASLLHSAILAVAAKLDTNKTYTPYLSGYGEYIATQGYGEYIATQGYGGFGAYQQYGGPFQQAAAGYGAMMQAAAGPFQQAAAGYGAIQQAAAGTGEYIASGVQGYGEYIATQGYGDASYTYDGIPGGDLSAAEHALNVAEAAAGLGFGDDAPPDVGLQSMVNPLNPMNAGSVGPGVQQLPIQGLTQGVPGLPGPKATIAATPVDQAMEDATSTGRRGVLGGGDGIFGGCSPMGQRDWQ